MRVAALLFVLLAAACGGNDEAIETVTVTVTGTTAAGATTPRLPFPLPTDGSLPVAAFNDYTESIDEPWERDPALVTAEFVGQHETETGSTSYQGTANGDTATTSLQLEGLLDDSVSARRYDLELNRRPDGTWKLESAAWAQRCQEGRGHQDFSPELCL